MCGYGVFHGKARLWFSSIGKACCHMDFRMPGDMNRKIQAMTETSNDHFRCVRPHLIQKYIFFTNSRSTPAGPMREFVCKLPSSWPRSARKGGPERATARGGSHGTRGAQTLRWPTFYAGPRLRLQSGSFFRKRGTLAAALCVLTSQGHPLEACQDQFSDFF